MRNLSFYCDDSRRRNEGRTADALASIGDERRGKLRKRPGIGKHELIRPYLNGATRQVEDLSRIIYTGKLRELKHLST